MTEEQRELAALYAFGILAPDEAQAFEKELAADEALRAEVEALAETIAELGHLAPVASPSPALKQQIMAKIESKPVANVVDFSQKRGSYGWSLTGWGLAAAFAVSAAWLWNDREKLQQDVVQRAERETAVTQLLAKLEEQSASLQSEVENSKSKISILSLEVEQWKKKDALSSMQIATLQSTVDEFKQGVAVVIWDAEKQEGVLKLEKMPPVAPDKDYQLWVVDPKKKDPVDAGVVRVDKDGFARIFFKPIDIISEAAKFALSVEREGGVPKGEGPIVLIGP